MHGEMKCAHRPTALCREDCEIFRAAVPAAYQLGKEPAAPAGREGPGLPQRLAPPGDVSQSVRGWASWSVPCSPGTRWLPRQGMVGTRLWVVVGPRAPRWSCCPWPHPAPALSWAQTPGLAQQWADETPLSDLRGHRGSCPLPSIPGSSQVQPGPHL